MTGRSLADRIRNAQRARLSEADRNDPEVATGPEVVREGPGPVFARGIRRRTYRVTLALPAALPAGAEARVRTGCPAPGVERFVVAASPRALSLPPRLRVVDASRASLRHDVEMLGSLSVSVAERGAPVTEPDDRGAMADLGIDPNEPVAGILLIDDHLALSFRRHLLRVGGVLDGLPRSLGVLRDLPRDGAPGRSGARRRAQPP